MPVKYIEFGELIDPRKYIAALPEFSDSLPAGAREFANDVSHYDFSSRRCVKDLIIREVIWSEIGQTAHLSVRFVLNEWKHDEDLLVSYQDVREARLNILDSHPLGSSRVGRIILDEIVPAAAGVSHEIAFTGGDAFIRAADLTAEWVPAHPNDRS
jgi:hypothetical protein